MLYTDFELQNIADGIARQSYGGEVVIRYVYGALFEMAKKYEAEIDKMQAHVAEEGRITNIYSENSRLANIALANANVRIAELHAAATAALGWIDEIYPAVGEAFDGSSGDEGSVRIAAIRENLRQALQEAPRGFPPK